MAEKFGLIGDPIGHSLSPLLFGAGFRSRPDLSYELIEGRYFEESYRKFMNGYTAINVTAPFKEQAFEKADIVSGPSTLIGAANILKKTPEGVACYNSDFTGVILCVAEAYAPQMVPQFYAQYGANAHVKIHQAMKQIISQAYEVQPEAFIVGCGGAGKAAAVAAAELGYRVNLWNRTASVAEQFAKGLPEFGMNVVDDAGFADAFGRSQLVIYALPVRSALLDGLDSSAFASPSGMPPKLVIEANYRNPSFAGALREKLELSGAVYQQGERWLLNQAVSGYPIMTGAVPSLGAMEDDLSKFLSKK